MQKIYYSITANIILISLWLITYHSYKHLYKSLHQSMPTDSTEMGSIKDEKLKLLSLLRSHLMNAMWISDMAIKKLNKRKGDHGFYLYHIILSTNKFKTIIVMLINCMLIHDHNLLQ